LVILLGAEWIALGMLKNSGFGSVHLFNLIFPGFPVKNLLVAYMEKAGQRPPDRTKPLARKRKRRKAHALRRFSSLFALGA
jgi:hypothetical protein